MSSITHIFGLWITLLTLAVTLQQVNNMRPSGTNERSNQSKCCLCPSAVVVCKLKIPSGSCKSGAHIQHLLDIRFLVYHHPPSPILSLRLFSRLHWGACTYVDRHEITPRWSLCEEKCNYRRSHFIIIELVLRVISTVSLVVNWHSCN